MRAVWLSQGERLGICYELLQASTKMRLATPEEAENNAFHPQAVCELHVSHVTAGGL